MSEPNTKNTVALTLRISPEMLAQIDEVVWEKRMTRTEFIRESLLRNLEYFQAGESRSF